MNLALVLLLAMAAPEKAPTPELVAAPAPVVAPEPVAASAPAETRAENLDAALDELLSRSREAVRVAVLPVTDDDAERARSLEAALVRALIERGREEVVTPTRVRNVLADAAKQALEGGEYGAFRALSADHVLLSEVVDAGGEVRLALRLVHVETGVVVAETAPKLLAPAKATSVEAPSSRAALSRLADALLLAIETLPGEPRYQRVAVAPLVAESDEAKNARVDRFVQAELSRLLAERGFLVVERARLDAVLAQMSLGAELGEAEAPEVGKLLDAQALVLGSIAAAGDRFVVTCRAVDTGSAKVLGAASVELPRAGVVTLASGAVETRTPEEALFRSLIAPGWGQFYNREPVKGFVFAGAGYGGALVTLGLGVAAGVSWSSYLGYEPAAGTPPSKVAGEIQSLRDQTDALLIATTVAAVVTAGVWGAGAVDAFLNAAE